ncbi:MAG: peptide chain release factor N(5)-glutamine methyltransferase [Solirubrobacterales bacterium]
MTASDIHHSGVGRMSDAVRPGSVREALGAAIDALAAAGVEGPRLDAELLLAEAIGWERARLVADPGAEVPPAAARRFGEMVRRRLRREPVAYILGRKGFRYLELAVDRRVLIPRPETELLVEVALELRPERVLDVGTGSGAIALAVADELPECEVVATDTSPAALEVARANAERLGLAERVRFLEGTLPPDGAPLSTSGLQTRPVGFDLVLANLPYVAERDWSSLQPEVTRWEPREALLAGPDGLDAYRPLVPECAGHLHRYAEQKTGALAVEVGEGQALAVAELFREAGFGGIETRRDLAGIERVVLGHRVRKDA